MHDLLLCVELTCLAGVKAFILEIGFVCPVCFPPPGIFDYSEPARS